MKKKVLLSSALMIVLCLCLVVGSTFALFTSSDKVDVSVSAGKVEIDAGIENALKTWSLGYAESDARADGKFENGGTAAIENGVLKVDLMTPGDKLQFTISVKNTSNVATKYRLIAVSEASDDATVKDLSEALEITAEIVAVNGAATSNSTVVMSYSDTADERSFETDWFSAAATDGEIGSEILTITVTVSFPNGTPEHDNAYQNGKASLTFAVEAVQANGVDANGNLIQ